jgi:hypothetical protein
MKFQQGEWLSCFAAASLDLLLEAFVGCKSGCDDKVKFCRS